MGYFDGLYGGVMDKLAQAKAGSASAIKGSFAGAQREGEAGIKLSAQRGGYAGSPVESALKRKFAANLQGQQWQALQNLESGYLGQLGQLESAQAQASAQERLQRDIANQQLWGNIIGGAGSLLGGVTKILGIL